MKSLSREFVRRKDPTRRRRIEELRIEQLKAAGGGVVEKSSMKGFKEQYRNTVQVMCVARSRR